MLGVYRVLSGTLIDSFQFFWMPVAQCLMISCDFLIWRARFVVVLCTLTSMSRNQFSFMSIYVV